LDNVSVITGEKKHRLGIKAQTSARDRSNLFFSVLWGVSVSSSVAFVVVVGIVVGILGGRRFGLLLFLPLFLVFLLVLGERGRGFRFRLCRGRSSGSTL
jgi:hypothetical protein